MNYWIINLRVCTIRFSIHLFVIGDEMTKRKYCALVYSASVCCGCGCDEQNLNSIISLHIGINIITGFVVTL